MINLPDVHLKVERYADNGELSHYEIINKETGEHIRNEDLTDVQEKE